MNLETEGMAPLCGDSGPLPGGQGRPSSSALPVGHCLSPGSAEWKYSSPQRLMLVVRAENLELWA